MCCAQLYAGERRQQVVHRELRVLEARGEPAQVLRARRGEHRAEAPVLAAPRDRVQRQRAALATSEKHGERVKKTLFDAM